MMLRARTAGEAPAEAPSPQLPASAAGATVTPLFLPVRPRPAAPLSPYRFLSLRALSFLLVVLLPVAIGAVYYLAIAADQYVAEFRLSLRTADAPPVRTSTWSTRAAGMSFRSGSGTSGSPGRRK